MPYAGRAWRRARLATRKENDEALLRRVRLLLEKTKIKQVLPALSQSLAGESVERILAYAFPDAAAIFLLPAPPSNFLSGGGGLSPLLIMAAADIARWISSVSSIASSDSGTDAEDVDDDDISL